MSHRSIDDVGGIAMVSGVRLYREGLADMLRRRGLRVVWAASAAEEALAACASARPGVALVDIAPPLGLEALRALANGVPGLRLVVLAVEDEDTVVACAEAGASGYVTRGQTVDELVSIVVSVARGEMPCSPRVASALMRRLGVLAAGDARGVAGRLTQRELEIVGLIGEGLSNKEIATSLVIELSTVKNHVHNILEKLDVSRRADAAALVGGRRRGAPLMR